MLPHSPMAAASWQVMTITWMAARSRNVAKWQQFRGSGESPIVLYPPPPGGLEDAESLRESSS